MLKIVLKYSCVDNGKVFSVLKRHEVLILKNKDCFFDVLHTRVTFIISDYIELSQMIYELNQYCSFGVQLVKVKEIKEKKKWQSQNNYQVN